jgi:hypothetical protein
LGGARAAPPPPPPPHKGDNFGGHPEGTQAPQTPPLLLRIKTNILERGLV